MQQVPQKRERVTKHVEWTMQLPIDAKEFEFGLARIRREMEDMDLDLSYDDCYKVKATEEEIIFSVKIKA